MEASRIMYVEINGQWYFLIDKQNEKEIQTGNNKTLKICYEIVTALSNFTGNHKHGLIVYQELNMPVKLYTHIQINV